MEKKQMEQIEIEYDDEYVIKQLLIDYEWENINSNNLLCKLGSTGFKKLYQLNMDFMMEKLIDGSSPQQYSLVDQLITLNTQIDYLPSLVQDQVEAILQTKDDYISYVLNGEQLDELVVSELQQDGFQILKNQNFNNSLQLIKGDDIKLELFFQPLDNAILIKNDLLFMRTSPCRIYDISSITAQVNYKIIMNPIHLHTKNQLFQIHSLDYRIKQSLRYDNVLKQMKGEEQLSQKMVDYIMLSNTSQDKNLVNKFWYVNELIPRHSGIYNKLDTFYVDFKNYYNQLQKMKLMEMQHILKFLYNLN